MTPAQLPVSLRQPVHSRFDVGKTSLRVHIECHQLVILLLKLFYCLLLLFDGIEHGPQDGIVINQQVALVVLAHRLRNDLLHGLGPQNRCARRST